MFMALNPTKLSDIKLGMYVEIKDLRTEALIEGKITFIISQSDHPEGILVKINDENKGHVKKILHSTIENEIKNQTEKIELLPESFNLEYKQFFKYFGNDEKNSWIPSFTVFKAIAGMANAEGGKVIIGVKDEKNQPLEITGLKEDFEIIGKIKTKNKFPYSADQDGMNLKISSEFAHYFPEQELVEHLVNIEFFGKEPENMICVINVKRSADAVVMYDNKAPANKQGPHFFVRINNHTKPHKPQHFCRYWAKHLLGMLGEEKLFYS